MTTPGAVLASQKNWSQSLSATFVKPGVGTKPAAGTKPAVGTKPGTGIVDAAGFRIGDAHVSTVLGSAGATFVGACCCAECVCCRRRKTSGVMSGTLIAADGTVSEEIAPCSMSRSSARSRSTSRSRCACHPPPTACAVLCHRF